MNRIYSSPLRVYLCLGFLALVGIYSGLQLPISLFPNSSKPKIFINISYGASTAEEFLNTYGRHLEVQLRGISTSAIEVDKITSTYDVHSAEFIVEFKWGVSGREALKEVQLLTTSFAAQMPQEMRDSARVNLRNDNQGFLAISFFSSKRSLDELYKYLEPVLVPPLAKIQDASEVGLWNPSRKEIQIGLDPEKMAAFNLFPRDIDTSVVAAIAGSGGGSVKIGISSLDVTMPRQVKSIDEIGGILIPTPAGKFIRLSDIATIDLGAPTSNDRSFKTSGEPSLILFADPRPGGNIKRMAEEILRVVVELAPGFPQDIHYKVLVDPSEFIRNAVSNVFREVAVAALLAVLVLFLFIGNLKNVVTAAIEIPMSIVLAFILMRFMGINLNLISLGGLALSAGMNVDASVVVMENIFRKFDEIKGPLSYHEKAKILSDAVSEVRFPVIASTIASLVVFLPLAFTSELSNAVLGDLALAVVFSHGFSAVVALVLVPTVRLQMISFGGSAHGHSPIEKYLVKAETLYSKSLGIFLSRGFLKKFVYAGLAVTLVLLMTFVIPKLPKEIIGLPDTDWMMLNVSSQGNTMVRQMETLTEETESKALKQFGDRVLYTFTQVGNPNSGTIMLRLKNKSEAQVFWKDLEKAFPNTPTLFFNVFPWNPSEMPIPDPPQMRVAFRGGDNVQRLAAARDVQDLFQQQKTFSHLTSDPGIGRRENIVFSPHLEQWALLQNKGVRVLPSDLSDISRVSTVGRRLGYIPIDATLVPIVLHYPEERVRSLEDLASFPIGVGGKLIPIKALMALNIQEISPVIRREEGREVILIDGKVDKGEEEKVKPAVSLSKKIVSDWKLKRPNQDSVSVAFEDPEIELTSALKQLGQAVAISILLIFLTMVLQFGNIANSLIVLVAIPLGFIGVLLSLFIFRSTLSLNSVLGVILLNGIVVANSIILVDFMRRLVAAGKAPREAALEAATKRLRPILMTSLTTGLGMLPIALGFGEGGKILQPLGIAVTGGLCLSVFLTLFIVPSLQVSYLEMARHPRPSRGLNVFLVSFFLAAAIFASVPPALAGTAVSFEQALNEMTERHSTVLIQETKVRASKTRVDSRVYKFLPQVSVSGSQSNSTNSGAPPTNTVSASASVNLFRAGADVAAIDAAKKDRETEENRLVDAVLLAEQESAEVLVVFIAKHLQIETLERSVQTFKTGNTIAHQRYDRGLLALQEVDKVSVDLANAEARLRDSQIEASTSEANLSRLLGCLNVEKIWPWKEFLQKKEVQKLLKKEILFRERPDYKTALASVDAETARKKQTFRQEVPSIDLTGSTGTSQYLGQPFIGNSTSIGLTIPLFNGLSDSVLYKLQVENLAAAEIKLHQTLLDIEAQSKATQVNLGISIETALAREKTLQTSRKLYETNVQRLKQGRASADELAIDQQRLTDSELLSIQGWSAAHLDYTRLCHAFGRRVKNCLQN